MAAPTLSPKNPELRIAKLRKAQAGGWYNGVKLDGRSVDPMTADMIVKIYDGLSPENRAKFIEMPYPKMVAIGMGLINKGVLTWKVGSDRRKLARHTIRRVG